MENSRVFALSENVSLQNLGENEGAVLLFIDTGQLYTCNDTTAAFLSEVDGKKTLAQIVARLGDDFDVARDELEEDIVALAAQLVREGIIQE